jgi:hypothetical protein
VHVCGASTCDRDDLRVSCDRDHAQAISRSRRAPCRPRRRPSPATVRTRLVLSCVRVIARMIAGMTTPAMLALLRAPLNPAEFGADLRDLLAKCVCVISLLNGSVQAPLNGSFSRTQVLRARSRSSPSAGGAATAPVSDVSRRILRVAGVCMLLCVCARALHCVVPVNGVLRDRLRSLHRR